MSEFNRHSYVAFGERGDYTRNAETIGELPTAELRMAAIKKASDVLGLRVQFGVKVGHSNKFKRSEIESDASGLLALRGDQLPLSILQLFS